jgi:TatA/E family protein of Tat protein translocase
VFSFGGSEIFIVAVLVVLLFGPDKLPQLARTVGRFTREFNKYKDIMESTIRMEMSRVEAPEPDTMSVEDRITKAGAASQAIIDKRAVAEAAERARDIPVLVADESDEEEEE